MPKMGRTVARYWQGVTTMPSGSVGDPDESRGWSQLPKGTCGVRDPNGTRHGGVRATHTTKTVCGGL